MDGDVISPSVVYSLLTRCVMILRLTVPGIALRGLAAAVVSCALYDVARNGSDHVSRNMTSW